MKPAFFRKVLKNGMTLVFEKRDLPVVSVAIALRCGAINESEEEKGISHFIEHMLYKGTKTRSAKQIAEDIEKRGGELNGFTIENLTAYWCKLPSEHLNIALDVLSDMVKNPLFNEVELEKERKVIFEEIKMYHDNPRLHVEKEIKEALYSKPFGMSIAGTEETMSGIDRKKLIERFKKFYKPNNMILCVVGDADFSELVGFAEKNFSNEKGIIEEHEFSLTNNSKLEKRKGIDQASLVLGFHSPLSTSKKSYASIVLNALMADGMSSRLFQEIREKRNLAYAVKGYSEISNHYSYGLIYVGTSKENVSQVKELIIEEFKKVFKNLNEKELAQIKEQLIGNYHISMEDSQVQMMGLLNFESNGNAKEFYEYEKNISSVSLEEVKQLAKQASEKFSFFALVPE